MKVSRAVFLKMLSLAFAFVSLAGCRRTAKNLPSNFHPKQNKPSLKQMEKEIEAVRKKFPKSEEWVEISRPGKHPRFPNADVRLGMAIDLDRCDGCGECALACMRENNVPCVNPQEAEKGRYMHWLELRGNVPVMCAHCGDAPCEKVCPTGAAVASPDGFSAMVYPRCIGTRFCGANCPLHIRKFNYTSAEENGLAYKFNPEVPIRPQGVMEKCSLCIQRMQDARIREKTLGDEWLGKGVSTACAEACPKQAIVFGNWLDPDSDLVRCTQGRGVFAPASVARFFPAVVYLRDKV